MRWQILSAAVLITAAAHPANAQVGPYRRFHEPVMDTNRNNRIVYVPVIMSSQGSRPGRQPFDVSVASWYLQPVGTANDGPDKTLDDGSYLLETFDVVRRDGDRAPSLRVVITRRPGMPSGADMPQLRVIHPKTLISTGAFPTVQALPDGVRYSYFLEAPMAAFAPMGDITKLPETPRYELHLLPARDVRLPQHIVRAPTFSGEDPATAGTPRPPRLPQAERVAGKRIEYRTGRVVQDR